MGGGLGTIVLILLALYFGVDPTFLLQNAPVGGGQQEAGPPLGADGQPDPAADFISVVLADTEDTWTQIFAAAGQQYQVPNLVLFSGAVQSACGFAQAAMGPFYCPADQKAYIDLSFYQDLRDRFQAPGDFAQAYVIAHEVGHHVQNLLGLSGKVQQARQQASEAEGNALSVRLELQADCLAGIWANHADRTRQILERATSRRRWRRPAPSATTGCSSSPRATSRPTPSPTAAPSSACAGSSAVSRPASWKPATPSGPSPSERRFHEPSPHRALFRDRPALQALQPAGLSRRAPGTRR